MTEPTLVTTRNVALATDLYQLTMVQAYVAMGMNEPASFSLFVRNLPRRRRFLVAAGLADALDLLETLRFDDQDIRYLRSLDMFSGALLDYLAAFRFSGSVRAVREGTPIFAGEPILEVTAPMPEAQLVETLLLNQVHFQTLVASKAARIVHAAQGRPVVDFGLRRASGLDAGIKAARAAYLAGVSATSNVAAGRLYGIPLAGTMAHSFIEAVEHETEAFRAFAAEFPGTTVLVDTYDTAEAVLRVARLNRDTEPGRRAIASIRIDSGDLAAEAAQARRLLDNAGLQDVQIFLSGGLDEQRIHDLVTARAPVDAFGVGTRLVCAADEPTLDSAYKLVEYAGRPTMKRSTGKATLPGRKQIYRARASDGTPLDEICLAGEQRQGEPLLQEVMCDGRRMPAANIPLADARDYCASLLASLPESLRDLTPPETHIQPRVSPRLDSARADLERRLRAAGN